MPQQGNRSFGLETQKGAGKGSKSRITDTQAYRANFENINWSKPIDLNNENTTTLARDNFRMLAVAEIKKIGDEFFDPINASWRPVPWFGHGSPVLSPNTVRRAIEKDNP